MEIEAQLEALGEGRVVDGDPAEVKATLLGEQDDIEFRHSLASWEDRND